MVECGLKNLSEDLIEANKSSLSNWEFLQKKGKSSWTSIPFKKMNIQ